MLESNKEYYSRDEISCAIIELQQKVCDLEKAIGSDETPQPVVTASTSALPDPSADAPVAHVSDSTPVAEATVVNDAPETQTP